MPRGFMDDFEGEVISEKVHKGGLGEDKRSPCDPRQHTRYHA